LEGKSGGKGKEDREFMPETRRGCWLTQNHHPKGAAFKER